MANSNSFLSPYEIYPVDQENKYLRKLSYFIIKLYVVCTHWNRLFEAILMSSLNIQLLCRRSLDFQELAIFASWPSTMINLHWLELSMTRTIFHGLKGVRAIEVWLYFVSVVWPLTCTQNVSPYITYPKITTNQFHFLSTCLIYC